MRRASIFGTIVVFALTAGACAAERERVIETRSGAVRVLTVVDRLDHPWGLALLPDGSMLVTERAGRLRWVSREGEASKPLRGMPEVYARGQGGLLDVALDPDFASNRMVYLSYAEPGEDGASTAVARGRLETDGVHGMQVIFRQLPKVGGGNHFGSRLVFARDGTLFVTLGERFKFAPAQDLSGHLGAIVRINRDGSVPKDNPFVGRAGARPEIWSYGHRNVQGGDIHPETGALWTDEMGPRGGDELNIPQAGKNHGWPLVSWGEHYDGRAIPKPPTRPDLADAIHHWNPAISPSGMAFYTGALFPQWRGNLLLGGLTADGIVRVTLQGTRVTGEERLDLGTPIRHVRQAPDGAVYALTDESNGKILRLTPARPG
jgi:aldose sugar dehydrogenase